jgi:hypothetical protein
MTCAARTLARAGYAVRTEPAAGERSMCGSAADRTNEAVCIEACIEALDETVMTLTQLAVLQAEGVMSAAEVRARLEALADAALEAPAAGTSPPLGAPAPLR